VSSRSCLPTLVVSLYVVLFLFAIWSVVPSPVSGSAAVAASALDPQLSVCESGIGTPEGRLGSGSQPKDLPGSFTEAWDSGWMGGGVQDVYSCALLMGASYN
jgi:hypothetical protein